MPATMPFSENGISVHFPDSYHFRFSDCPAYIAIKSRKVKEMDIGWFDVTNNTLWLVEMKAFHNPNNPLYANKDLTNKKISDLILEELTLKSIHTVCQVNTDRAGTNACVGNAVTNSTQIKLVHLLRVLPGQEVFLTALQDELRNRLQPYSAIFNISAIVILSYDSSIGLLNWIV